MIKNLLLIALRNFRKDKWYSLLNVLGLTLGITFSLFLIFYIVDELGYDRFNEKADRIVRIVSYIQERDKNTNWTYTQMPLGPTFKKDNNCFYETKIYYADSNVFKIFTCHFLEGNANNALVKPNSIVISRKLA